MAKFFGKVGYVIHKETTPDVWTDEVTEVSYYGDVINLFQRVKSGDKVNDDISLNQKISIMADAFAYNNFSAIRYVEWMGVKWKVTEITPERPRILLTIGGEYNGEQTISV